MRERRPSRCGRGNTILRNESLALLVATPPPLNGPSSLQQARAPSLLSHDTSRPNKISLVYSLCRHAAATYFRRPPRRVPAFARGAAASAACADPSAYAARPACGESLLTQEFPYRPSPCLDSARWHRTNRQRQQRAPHATVL